MKQPYHEKTHGKLQLRYLPGTTQLERFVGPRKVGMRSALLAVLEGNVGSSMAETQRRHPWSERSMAAFCAPPSAET